MMAAGGLRVDGCGRKERREMTEVFFHRDVGAAQVPGSETGQAMSETGGYEAGLTWARIGRDDSKEAVMVWTVWWLRARWAAWWDACRLSKLFDQREREVSEQAVGRRLNDSDKLEVAGRRRAVDEEKAERVLCSPVARFNQPRSARGQRVKMRSGRGC